MTARRQQQGFTLIEMMIALAIVAVIAGVAIPAFLDSMMKSRRSDARSLLLQINAKQEAFFQNNRNRGFTTDFTELGGLAASTVTATSVTSENGYYTVTFDAPSTVTVGGRTIGYKLIATAIGKQAKDKCKTLAIDQDGTQEFTPDTATGCW